MPRRYYSYVSSSVSADSYRIAPPLPYGRRSRVSHTKTKTRVDRPKRRDDISADSVRVAPKVKPWRSRRGQDRGHRSRQGEELLPRAHSKPKSIKRSRHSRGKPQADNESSEYEPPADIRQNPFFKDIWEKPKPPKVRKPSQPRVVPAPPRSVAHKPPANQPKNNKKKIAGQTAKTKPTVKPPPPPGPHNSGIPGLNGQTMLPQPVHGQAPPPPGHQPPPPAPDGGHYNTQSVAPHGQQPMHTTTYLAAPYNVVPPGLTPNQKLAQMRAHYERLQGQSYPMAQYLVSEPPQASGQYSRPLPLSSQYQTNVNPYEVREAAVSLYEARRAAEADARQYEEAQSKLAAIMAKHKEVTEKVAALKAKGPDYPKVHSSGKHESKTSAEPEDYIARLGREYREAVAEAKRAGVKFPKHVSINDEPVLHYPIEYSSPETSSEYDSSPRRGNFQGSRGRTSSASQGCDHHGRQSRWEREEYEPYSRIHHRGYSIDARDYERGVPSHDRRSQEERYLPHRRSSSHDPRWTAGSRNIRPRTPRRGFHQEPHVRDDSPDAEERSRERREEMQRQDRYDRWLRDNDPSYPSDPEERGAYRRY